MSDQERIRVKAENLRAGHHTLPGYGVVISVKPSLASYEDTEVLMRNYLGDRRERLILPSNLWVVAEETQPHIIPSKNVERNFLIKHPEEEDSWFQVFSVEEVAETGTTDLIMVIIEARNGDGSSVYLKLRPETKVEAL